MEGRVALLEKERQQLEGRVTELEAENKQLKEQLRPRLRLLRNYGVRTVRIPGA